MDAPFADRSQPVVVPAGRGHRRGVFPCGRWLQWTVLPMLVALLCAGCGTFAPPGERLTSLPGLSGLAWVGGDQFVAVHDAKGEGAEAQWNRVSLLRLPRSKAEGLVRTPLSVRFPGRVARDLEAAGPIPGGGLLFAESGQKGERARLFFARLVDGALVMDAAVPWPFAVDNVEAVEVGRLGDQLVLLAAERGREQASTTLRWATLELDPVRFGPAAGIDWPALDPLGPRARAVFALTLDPAGRILVASTLDPGEHGPFRSVVWRIGVLCADADGRPQVRLEEPVRIATLDGGKIESLAVRTTAAGGTQLFAGTDDEHYGGLFRPLPAAD